MDLIQCPNCGSVNVMIYENLDLVRAYPQDKDGIDAVDFDEEWDPKLDPMMVICSSCSHRWISEYCSIDELV